MEAQRILNVQIPAYQVEADLIGYAGIPALFDTVASIQECGETFYGFYMDGTLAGFISYEKDQQQLDICRMVVHPVYFRRGIAKRLLSYLLEHESDTTIFTVGTGKHNLPAISLYEQNGFVISEERLIDNQLEFVRLQKIREK